MSRLAMCGNLGTPSRKKRPASVTHWLNGYSRPNDRCLMQGSHWHHAIHAQTNLLSAIIVSGSASPLTKGRYLHEFTTLILAHRFGTVPAWRRFSPVTPSCRHLYRGGHW